MFTLHCTCNFLIRNKFVIAITKIIGSSYEQMDTLLWIIYQTFVIHKPYSPE